MVHKRLSFTYPPSFNKTENREWYSPILTSPGMNVAQSYTATWPQKIQITPAQEKAITPQEFTQWAYQNNGVLCRITAQHRPETPPNNESLLNQLISSLAEKSMVSLFRGSWTRGAMLNRSKYAVAGWPLPNGSGVRRTMVMFSTKRMLIGAVFPLTGFTEMPKAGSASQQQVQQQAPQQPVQQVVQPQPSMPPIPQELIPRLQMIRAMQVRLGAAGRNVGPPFTGNFGDVPGSTPQPGTANPIQQHQQVPSLEMMQALMHRKQDG